MLIDGTHFQTIWAKHCGDNVTIIDQTKLPHQFAQATLGNISDAATAISTMQVRGAPLIGATAAFGIYLAARENPTEKALSDAEKLIVATRPTAINLRWAVSRIMSVILSVSESDRAQAAFTEAQKICLEDMEACRLIGVHGVAIIKNSFEQNPDRPVNILTHCNAGWLATIDWGTATSPFYHAQLSDIPIHVWVDETRPRNQGAALTCYELGHQGIAHTVITDNAGGHLMQRGKVDLVITGTDRTARNGDVANKIGTYLKALAAKDNNVPFYVALPSSTIDWECKQGKDIPIEYRSEQEVTHMSGISDFGKIEEIRLTPENTSALNPAFDVTPAGLISGLITERGVATPSICGLRTMFPEVAG